jgi:hypothetical protein
MRKDKIMENTYRNSLYFSINLLLIWLSMPILASEINTIQSFTILQNTAYEGCPYSGPIAVKVKYTVMTEQGADININTTEDGVYFAQSHTYFVEQGRGQIVIEFNAGECVQDIEVIL